MTTPAQLPRPLEELTAFLQSLGTEDVEHTGGDFLHHLQAVHDLLLQHGAPPHVAAAGLFHSIYGTEGFQEFSLPLSQRPQVRDLIGPEAELLAWANCVMDRQTLDQAVDAALTGACEHLPLRERETNAPIELTRHQLIDLAQVHLFDWLEQVHRSPFGWNYRRQAYKQMAHLTNHTTLYTQTFSQEPPAQPERDAR